MTMLLGGAKLLKKREAELKGTVKLIFQPAEEGGAGGERIVQEGTRLDTVVHVGHLTPELLKANTFCCAHKGNMHSQFL